MLEKDEQKFVKVIAAVMSISYLVAFEFNAPVNDSRNYDSTGLQGEIGVWGKRTR